ncbi:MULTISPECIES: hypothetical protein [unclassified Janthinobacterium]|uniref:hypothetical protein n=1 Tax=unclassified Janthinobacterium TaxID=2610881 RepID=UPI001619B348|nr:MULTISPECIES: hypothetical protein [unclassified Janthinobacterium]MBB5369269.1 hypothetical protein [Janthinobacterium sp. K2C7]MBB5381195.1 hypothetical protein [Janthinobacterium sp. K2Li3]MBB5387652.1 hypothetical protein [Janthinobacterium sp. K2E3]
MVELSLVEVDCVSGAGEGSASERLGEAIGSAARWVWDNMPRMHPNSEIYA